MQKINHNRRRKPWTRIAIIALLLLLLGFSAYAYLAKKGPFAPISTSSNEQSTIDYNPPTPEQSQTGDDIKDSILKNGTTGSDASPPPTPSTDGSKPSVGVEITAANQDGDVLYIRSLIQTISSNGTCTLRLSGPNNTLYTESSSVQALPSTSTCKGFDIPVSKLAQGSWQITLSYEDSSTKGITTKEVVIK